jgi:hypothetical protein
MQDIDSSVIHWVYDIPAYRFTLYAMPTPTLAGATLQSTEAELAASIPTTSIASAALSGES